MWEGGNKRNTTCSQEFHIPGFRGTERNISVDLYILCNYENECERKKFWEILRNYIQGSPGAVTSTWRNEPFILTTTKDKLVQWLPFPVKVITSLWLPSLLFTDLFPRGIRWGEPKQEEVWVCSRHVNNGSPQTPSPGPASHETPWRCYWPQG